MPSHECERCRRPPGEAAPPSGGRRSPRHVHAEPVQGAGNVADRIDGDAGIERCRLQLGVPEQNLDKAMSTFCSSRWVAKLCRKVCGDTRLVIPVACAAT